MSTSGSSPLPFEVQPPDGSSRKGSTSVVPPPPDGAAPSDELTVISQRPPIAGPSAARPTQPFELGVTLAGQRLGHFELREYVGGGGMGAVFRALDTLLNREVALKVLSRDQGADDDTRRRFQNEAQSAARLDHENIARVYYVGEDQGLNYIVFEFIDGVNLRDLVAQGGPLPLAEAISYTLQVAEALAHANSRDVVHRDIKPSNVIITADGRAKIVDMGLARLHQVDRSGEDLTASGVTLGTFDYISPEQARDPRMADVRSDIYSLGCSLYYLLTARPPFPEGTVLQKLLQHNSDEPPDPREFNPELPEEVSALVRKMLAKDPRRRYQNPAELTSDLLLLADEVGLPSGGHRGMAWMVQGSEPMSFFQRHLPWMAPVAALLAIVVLLDWAWSNPGEPPVDTSPLAAAHEPPASRGPAGAKPEPDTKTNLQGDDEPNAGHKPPTGAHTSAIVKSPDGPTARPERASPAGPRGANGAEDGAEELARPAAPVDPARTSQIDQAPFGEGAERAGTSLEVRVGGSPSAAATVAEPGGATQAEVSGAAGASAPPAAEVLPVPGEDSPRGLLVVSGSEKGPHHYPSLRAACEKAKNGDVIELRYNGRREEKPISLANLKITIRSSEPFRPVVVFRPDDPDPVKYPRSMLTVRGGSLKLVHVALELDLPRGVPADSWWSLVETQLAESVELTHCHLTIRNASDQRAAYHQEVAFFNVKAPPGASMMASKGMPLNPVAIRLVDCVARGEALFLRAYDLQPVRFSWDNGLLATTERLLLAAGGTSPPAAADQVRIELRHLTADVRGGLCRVTNSSDAPWLLDTVIDCSDSILLAAADAPLIEQAGVESPASMQQHLSWNGERNFYQGFSAFWRITDLGSAKEPLELSSGQWQAFWLDDEIEPHFGPVLEPPGAERPVHTLTAADYPLGGEVPGNPNPARKAAFDGRDAGVDPRRLPFQPPGGSPREPIPDHQPAGAAQKPHGATSAPDAVRR